MTYIIQKSIFAIQSIATLISEDQANNSTLSCNVGVGHDSCRHVYAPVCVRACTPPRVRVCSGRAAQTRRKILMQIAFSHILQGRKSGK